MHTSQLGSFLNKEINSKPVYKSPGIFTQERNVEIFRPSPLGNIEPSRSNRFIVTVEDSPEILVWYFKNYRITRDMNSLYLDVEIMETLNYTFNPATDFENMTRFKIENLDPTGVVVGTIRFTASVVSYERVCDYANDDILTVKIRMLIDQNTYISETLPRPQQVQTDLIPELNRLGIEVNYTGIGMSGWAGTCGT